MAVIDQITIGNTLLIVTDSDPTSVVNAAIGSIVVRNDGGGFYYKTGATNANWSQATDATNSSALTSLPNLVTIGTITSGTWNGSAIIDTYISSAATWNAKQNALNGTGFVKSTAGTISYDTSTYLTTNQSITLSSEASGTGSTSIAVTLSNAAVIAKVLTGYTSGAGTISATDSILSAIQKLNGNIGALVTGVSSVTGTTNRITSSGGATPAIDIAATYVGQASITTLGTITTGVWNGTAIANANLANSAITVNGASTSLGATVTITTTGTSNRISVSGGTGNRITGDFSNATFTNRVHIQTSTTNSNTNVGILPNGSATTSGIRAYNNADPTNASYIGFSCTPTICNFAAQITGTGTFLPMTFETNNTERLRITTNGGFSFGSSGTAYGTSGQALISAGDAPPVYGTLGIGSGGTGQTTATLAFNALDPLTTKGDIIVHNGTDSIRLAVGTNGQELFADSTVTAGVKWTSKAVVQSDPADPTTTTSATGVMMGLAATITPTTTGNVLIVISGDIDNATTARGATVMIRTGTGAAPANGAALTGTVRGETINFFQNNNTIRVPFHLNFVVTGLTVGTAIWVDLALATVTGGTARVRNVSVSLIEV